MPSYVHCSQVWILIISFVAAGCKYRGWYGGCDSPTDKRAICRAIASPLQGSNDADEPCCIYTPEYVHTTGQRPKKTRIFILYCKGAFPES